MQPSFFQDKYKTKIAFCSQIARHGVRTIVCVVTVIEIGPSDNKTLRALFSVDRCAADPGVVGADAGAGRVRHGLRTGHRAGHGDADGHQLPAVCAGGHIVGAVRQRPGPDGVQHGRPVLPLQGPQPVAPGPGHERPVHGQPVHRAGRVRRVLPLGRILHHQDAHVRQPAAQDTAVLQEVPAARINRPRRFIAASSSSSSYS